jgi:cytochrome P450
MTSSRPVTVSAPREGVERRDVTGDGGCPVHFDRDRGMWSIADPAMVRSVLQAPDVFGPHNSLTAYRTLTVRSLRTLNRVGFALPAVLANNAGPTHRRIRACVAHFLGAGRVDALQDTVTALVRAQLPALTDALAGDRPADLVELIAGPVPALTLLRLFGIVGPPIGTLKRWSRDSLELFWGTPDPDRQEALASQAAEFYDWLRGLVTMERRAPGDGLLGALIGLGLTDEQVCSACYFLLIAGQETTTQLISTMFQRALENPPRWAGCADPDVVAALVECTLTTESPVPTWRRVVRRPVRLRGHDLDVGAEVLLRLTGIGGDAGLAFGVGVHRCLGQRLATAEARIVVSETASAFPGLRSACADPPMIDLLSFRAPAQVWAHQPGRVDRNEGGSGRATGGPGIDDRPPRAERHEPVTRTHPDASPRRR